VVAHLVRLKLALLRNGLRRSPWQVVGLAVGALYGLLVIVIVVVALAAASVQSADDRGLATVLFGSILVLGWWLVPLVSFGVDATVDPARFVTFTIPRRSMLLGLAIGAVVGIPGVVTAVSALAIAGTWWRTPGALLVAPFCALLGVATCIVGSRATTSAMSGLMSKRRVRELTAMVALVPLLLVGPLLSRVPVFSGSITREGLEQVADVLGWTPLGAAWAVPWEVATGDGGRAAARLAVALGTLAVVALVWDRALAHALVNPTHEAASTRARGLGWFGRLPATPLGATTARSLTYWVRDPRYALAISIVPLLPVILWILNPRGSSLLLLGPTAAFFMGWGISADVAYDGSAFWTHVAAPVTGLTDRLGRVLGASALAVPVVGVFVVGSAWLTGRPDAIPALLGVSYGVLCTAFGGASIVSALVVYPVQQPGENPFQTRQGASMVAVVSQLVGWSVVLALSVPAAVLALLSITQHDAGLGWVTLVVGPVLGGLLLFLGVRLGGRLLERNGPDLLRRILSFA
jgi:ABC-2 type transport system permease protein